MATFLAHLRVADYFLDFYEKISPLHFIAGSVAPDSGGLTQTTHWTDTCEKNDIRAEDFYDAYVKNEYLPEKKSFYLGYYVHLFTDILWWKYAWVPANDKKVKEDWQNIDRLFISENPLFRPLRILNGMGSFPNVYLDYFTVDAFENMIGDRLKELQSYDDVIVKEYQYFSDKEAKAIIERIAFEIKELHHTSTSAS